MKIHEKLSQTIGTLLGPMGASFVILFLGLLFVEPLLVMAGCVMITGLLAMMYEDI